MRSRQLLTLFTAILLIISSSVVFAGKSAVKLVEPEWLKKHRTDKQLVIVDMSDEIQYQRYHIPGSVSLPNYVLSKRLKSGVSVSIGSENVATILGKLGISEKTHIVLLDDTAGFNAGRLFWELERLGHRKISVLNGGLVSWVLKGYPVTNKPVQLPKTRYKISTVAKSDENLIDLNAIKKLDTSKVTLLDVRSKDEYIGFRTVPRSGHIPGAFWWPWTETFDVSNGFRFHDFKKLEKSVNKLGVKEKSRPMVVYCRSGHRAAQAYLTLKLMGYSSVRLYDGSILEYATDKSAVLKRGTTP